MQNSWSFASETNMEKRKQMPATQSPQTAHTKKPLFQLRMLLECSRCGRHGHLSVQCKAHTHVKGHKLEEPLEFRDEF